MAKMQYRESNQVKWVGVRPGHEGVQVAATKNANSSTGTIYTVPAGKVFYLCQITVTIDALATGNIVVEIRTAVPGLFINPMGGIFTAGQLAVFPPVTFWPPIELPAGYDIQITSNAAGLACRGNAFGWLEDA